MSLHAEFGEANAQFPAPGLQREQIGFRIVEATGPDLADRKVVRRDGAMMLRRRGRPTGRLLQHIQLRDGGTFGVGRVHDAGMRNSEGADQAFDGGAISGQPIADQLRRIVALSTHRREFMPLVVTDRGGQQGVRCGSCTAMLIAGSSAAASAGPLGVNAIGHAIVASRWPTSSQSCAWEACAIAGTASPRASNQRDARR